MEGFAKQRFSKAEFRRYFTISIASAKETELWLDFCFDLGYLNQGEHVKFKNDYLKISKMMSRLIENLNSSNPVIK